MKRRLLTILLAGAMVFMTACGSTDTTQKQETDDVVQEEVVSKNTEETEIVDKIEETEIVEETEVIEETEIVEEEVTYPKKITFTYENGTTVCEYDENGNVIKVLDDNGVSVKREWTLEYLNEVNGIVPQIIDGIESDKKLIWKEIPMLTYIEGKDEFYDETSLFDNDMIVYEYEYDADNRLVNMIGNTAIDKDGYVFNDNTYTRDEYEYLDGKLVIRYIDREYTTTYFYWFDEIGNITADACICVDGTCELKEYKYDERGNLIEIIDYDSDNVSYVDGQFDKSNATGNISRYIYDEKGNLISKTSNDYLQYENKYDENNQLLETKYEWGTTYLYNYDAQGLLTNYTMMSGDAQEDWMYEYDAAGRMISASLNDEQIYQFVYNEEGLLVNCKKNITEHNFFNNEIVAEHFKNLKFGNMSISEEGRISITEAYLDMVDFNGAAEITIEY